MSEWSSAKARKVLVALLRIGWTIKRESRGSHRILSRPGWPDVVFEFHDKEENRAENAGSYWQENRFNAKRLVTEIRDPGYNNIRVVRLPRRSLTKAGRL